jgi:hypothetical protein
MSAFIGDVRAPHHNSPDVGVEVRCSLGGVEVKFLHPAYGTGEAQHNFDPIAARNLAALLVRASEEAERMRVRAREDAERMQAEMRGAARGESR